MGEKEAEFLRRLRAAFQAEAEEHLQAISSGLLALEKSPDADGAARRREIVGDVFREAHSLKGAARAVNLGEVETVCQSLEGVLAAWRKGDVAPSADRLDPLHTAVRFVERMLPAADARRDAPAGDELAALLHALARLETGAPPDPPAARRAAGDAPPRADSPESDDGPAPDSRPAPDSHAPPPPAPPPVGETASARPAGAAPASRRPRGPKASLSDTLRISTAKLDSMLLQAEEMLAVKLTVGQRAAEVRAIGKMMALWEKEWAKTSADVRSLRQRLEAGRVAGAGNEGHEPDPQEWGPTDPDAAPEHAAPERAAPASARLLEFLDFNESQLKSVRDRVAALAKSIDQDRRATAGMVDALLESSKKLFMLPFSTLLEGFPKLVRELSRDQGKEVDLTLRGGEVEIDKRILEEMKDPLIHLLRNAVDHGIEPPAGRERGGKPARGSVALAVAQVEGNKVEIRVADDGAGIDPLRVAAAAVRRGVIAGDDAGRLTEDEAIDLIFRPDVSTSPILTEVSGRGMGMDIVKGKVEKLGGRVELQTRVGRGTNFRLLLPVTLATFRGILVRSADQLFVVPTAGVERVVRVRADDVKTVENRETLSLNGRAVAFVHLDEVLELPARPPAHPDRGDEPAAAARWMPVMVLGAGGKRVAFRVDAVLEEREVLVKRLGLPLSRVRNVAGATVLGSGRAVPILNVEDLLKSAARRGAGGARPAEAGGAGGAAARRASVLVAEDSITARMLVKNILESAGHRVTTAVDGVDALTSLKSGAFDLVVSDVEMPRMSGFELTAKIRADPKLAELPVILVTALSTREDRERGVDAGADAYIVKSSFDQSDLLATVKRLL